MAKPKAKDAAQKYLEDILAKIPEDKREAVKTAFGADEILEDLGEHVLRQSDYDRLAQEASATREKADKIYNDNITWYKENVAKLSAGEIAMKKLEEAADTRPAATTTDSTLEEQLKKATSGLLPRDEATQILRQVNAQQQLQTVDFVAAVTDLAQRHYIDFKEPLDTRAILKYAAEKQKMLPDAYREVYAEKHAAKAKSDEEAKVNQIRKEERAKIQAELSARGPYPMPDSSQNISPLSGIKLDKSSSHKSDAINAAVKEYEQALFAR